MAFSDRGGADAVGLEVPVEVVERLTGEPVESYIREAAKCRAFER